MIIAKCENVHAFSSIFLIFKNTYQCLRINNIFALGTIQIAYIWIMYAADLSLFRYYM